MFLTNSQLKTLNKIYTFYKNKDINKITSLKAPTGAGKTFIASTLISKILANNFAKDKKTIVVVATVSNAELPKQFARKLKEYKQYHEFNDYEIKHIESPSVAKSNKSEDIPEFVRKDRLVYVFGTSSFGKKSLFYQNRTLETFLEQIKYSDYELIFIRDEAHIGKKENITKEDQKRFDEKMLEASGFILEMTATPKNPKGLVEMTLKDLEADNQYLLKTNQIKTELTGDISNEDIIDDAIKAFKNSKKEYEKLANALIYPAMLIQVQNKPDRKRDKMGHDLFMDSLTLLESKLNEAGLIYLKYLDSKPVVVNSNIPASLKEASQSDSHIDAVIFKVGPATGWDIPRANMLLQLRNVSSENLNIQTLGRIMRNPYPNLEKNDVTDKYFVWSNYQKPTRDQATYRLKEKFFNLELPRGFIDTNSEVYKKSSKEYEENVKEFILNDGEFLIKLLDNIKKPEKKIIWGSIDHGNAKVLDPIINHIHLKIHNYKKYIELEPSYHLSLFDDEIKKLADKANTDIEIVKYTLIQFSAKLHEIKAKSIDVWSDEGNAYKIEKHNNLIKYYSLWKDNNDDKIKKVKTNEFQNYGYIQVHETDQDIQYLDSRPEMEFYKRFRDALRNSELKNIQFFAKMPTLGSKISFEYHNSELSRIAKSFADFIIKYNDKIFIIEVKGLGKEEYNHEKTKDIMESFWQYQIAPKSENIDFGLFTYSSKTDNGIMEFYYNGKPIRSNVANFIDMKLNNKIN